MNMVTALLSAALKAVPQHLVEESWAEICPALLKLLEDRASLSLQNEWVLPDAAWQKICCERPQVAIYPLGDIAERALKKTIYQLSPRLSGVEAVPESQHQHKDYLQTLARDVLKLFLTQYLFELCIDQLRRPSKDPSYDFGFLYHFLKSGDFAPLSVERDLRSWLSSQCEDVAKALCSTIQENIERGNFAQGFHQAVNNLYGILRLPKPKANIIMVGKEALARAGEFYIVEGHREVRHLELHTADANVAFTLYNIERCLGHSIHPLTRDLLDIGVSIYMADLYSKRESHLGRCINMLIAVRYPSIWEHAQKELERTVSFLGRDAFNVHFLQSEEKGEQGIDFSAKVDDKRCILLFSGGLDSLAGAVWALERGMRPILVSHYANNRLASLQKSLVAHLEQIYDQRLQHVGIYAGRARKQKAQNPLPTPCKSVMVQYLRSFMFLALAAGIAIEQGINTVYIFENGPVALNPSFSEARVNTRTAHPRYLEHFKALIKAVFGIELVIENPFLYFTKGEVVGVLGKSERTKPLIARTSSCVYWSRVPLMAKQRGFEGFRYIHDGACLPCIIRRVAIYSAGLQDYDTSYLVDIFSDYPNIDRDTLTALADYLRFCWNIRETSGEILSFAPDFSISVEGVDPRKLVEMYKRHSEEVIDCFRERSNDELRKCFAPVLK